MPGYVVHAGAINHPQEVWGALCVLAFLQSDGGDGSYRTLGRCLTKRGFILLTSDKKLMLPHTPERGSQGDVGHIPHFSRDDGLAESLDIQQSFAQE